MITYQLPADNWGIPAKSIKEIEHDAIYKKKKKMKCPIVGG